jgi:adiponectin receptor
MCKHASKIFTYDQLKDQHVWRGSNKYILRGYRGNMTKWEIFWSVLGFHNETVNVWTHLIGVLFFFFVMQTSFQTWLVDATYGERFCFLVWVLAAQFQMLSSACFHWWGDYSRRYYENLARLDYTSISVLIVASYFPVMYYIFRCHKVWQYVYLFLMASLGTLSIIISWMKAFQAPHLQHLRAGLFIVLSLIGLFSMPHGMYVVGLDFMLPIIYRLSLMGVLYIGGAMVYVTCIPERLYPGRFDICFSSHSIWHCFVVAATYAHYHAVFYMHHTQNECPLQA